MAWTAELSTVARQGGYLQGAIMYRNGAAKVLREYRITSVPDAQWLARTASLACADLEGFDAFAKTLTHGPIVLIPLDPPVLVEPV